MSAPPLPYRIGRLAWFALIGLQVLWHAWLAPPQTVPLALVLALTVLPLLLPLLALPDLRRALLWVGVLSLFYFSHAVAEAWSAPGERWLALAEMGLSLLLVVVLGAGVRRARKTAPGNEG